MTLLELVHGSFLELIHSFVRGLAHPFLKGTFHHYAALHNGRRRLSSPFRWRLLMLQFFYPPLFFATIARDYTAQIIAINQAMWRGLPEVTADDVATAKNVEAHAPQQPTPSPGTDRSDAVTLEAPKNAPPTSTVDSKVVVLADEALRRSLKSTASSTAITKRSPALKRRAKTTSKSAKRRR